MSITLESPLVSTGWLAEHIGNPDIRIIDCTQIIKTGEDGSYGFVSGQGEWQAGHIPNSIYVDVGTELSDPAREFTLMMPAPEIFAETMRSKGIGDGTAVVCYDRSNHAWAARVWWMLRVCGFDNAAVLDGGWKKWIAEDREVSTAQTDYAPAERFTVNPRPQLMADKATVRSACDDAQTQLLHSLPRPVFTGKITMYSRPGRIPGSRNLYCESLLDPETNCYVAREVMAQRLGATGSLESERVITYCGGGIAASSNALALTLLGHDNVAVYDGSLSEWTADPDMPMETD